MKLHVYFAIAIRILLLFTVGCLATFIPEQLRDFFGDTPCVNEFGCYGIDAEWKWGVRHYWYFWCMFCLFILSAISAFISIRAVLIRNYPTLKEL